MPLISVIIPTYNRAYILHKAVESVLSQTFKNIELIIIDDASEDSTPELIKDYAKKSQIPIIYHRNPERLGPAASRNIGIKLAKGKFIAFLDSDDWFLPEKLEKQLNFFQKNPSFYLVQTEERWYKQGKRIFPKRIHRKAKGFFFHRAVRLCVVSMSTVMVKKELFKEVGVFDPGFPVCEDYEFWLGVSLRFPVGLIEEELVEKDGGRPDQLSATKGLDYYRTLALIKLFRNHFSELTPEQKLLLYKEALKKFRIFFKGALKYGNLGKAFELKKEFENTFSHSLLSPAKGLLKFKLSEDIL